MPDNERATADRGVSQQSRGLATPPRQPARCKSHTFGVPDTYAKFEHAVEEWLSECVQSRTEVRGVPARRERDLVTDNASLVQLWDKIRGLVGQHVTIHADYVWSESRVEEVRFSVPAQSAPIETQTVVAPTRTKQDPPYEPLDSALQAVRRLQEQGKTEYDGISLKHLACLATTALQKDFDDHVILAEKFNDDMFAFMRGEKPISDLVSSFRAQFKFARNGEEDAIVLARLARVSSSVGQVIDFIRREEAKNTTDSMNKSLFKLDIWIVNNSRTHRSVYRCYALE